MAISINQCLTTGNQISVLGGQHEQVTIEGKVYGLITIGSRRYLIDYVRSKTGLAWYNDQTTHLEYVTASNADPTNNVLPVNRLCMPFLTGDQVRSSSWGDACRSTATLKQVIKSTSSITSANRSNYAGYYVGSLGTLGLRWSLPNYELGWYIINRLNEQFQGREEQDWLSLDTGWLDLRESEVLIYFWTPFSQSIIRSWIYVTGTDNSLGMSNYIRTGTVNSLITLPCTLI